MHWSYYRCIILRLILPFPLYSFDLLFIYSDIFACSSLLMTSAIIFRDICLTSQWFRIRRSTGETKSVLVFLISELLPCFCLWAFSYLQSICLLLPQSARFTLPTPAQSAFTQPVTPALWSLLQPRQSRLDAPLYCYHSSVFSLVMFDEWTNWPPDTLNFIEFETGKQGHCSTYSSD